MACGQTTSCGEMKLKWKLRADRRDLLCFGGVGFDWVAVDKSVVEEVGYCRLDVRSERR
jgi:hypothetical protein